MADSCVCPLTVLVPLIIAAPVLLLEVCVVQSGGWCWTQHCCCGGGGWLDCGWHGFDPAAPAAGLCAADRGLEFDPADRLPSAVDAYPEGGIALCGCSKSVGLPGIRIGWLASHDAARELRRRAGRESKLAWPPGILSPCQHLLRGLGFRVARV